MILKVLREALSVSVPRHSGREAEWRASETVTRGEIQAALEAVVGKRVRITWENHTDAFVGVVESVDDEGFMTGEEDGSNPSAYWVRFDGLQTIEVVD